MATGGGVWTGHRGLWLRAKELIPALRAPLAVRGSVVEVIVYRQAEGVDCLLMEPPDLPDQEVFSRPNERGACTAWQRALCDSLGLNKESVRFDWCF